MSRFTALKPVVAVCRSSSLCLTCKCPYRKPATHTLSSIKGFKAVIPLGFEISFMVNWLTDTVQITDLSHATLAQLPVMCAE